jgi:fido (protein-threonine AMPylation protein)
MNLTYLEIDHHRSDYDNMSDSLHESFMQRVVQCLLYHEHALDGIVLTPEEIDRALAGQPCRNYCDGLVQLSLRNLHDAFHRTRREARRGVDVTLDWLKDTHTSLCPEDYEAAGRYRKRDTSPGAYNLDVAASSSISYYLHKFLDAYDEEFRHYHPIRAAAIAHWEFMHVFPFDEKSGLVGRLMMNLILMRHHYPPAIICATDRQAYFSALDGHSSELIPVVVDAVRSTIDAARSFSARVESAPPGARAAL